VTIFLKVSEYSNILVTHDYAVFVFKFYMLPVFVVS